MGTKPELKTTRRRLRPAFDHLDGRLILSASPSGMLTGGGLPPAQGVETSLTSVSLSIISAAPAESATLVASPTSLLVTFDRPIDDFTLSSRDFNLVHVASDGVTSPLGKVEAALTESLDPSDPTGSRVCLSLDKALAPGHYRLLVAPNFQIQGIDGSSLATTSLGATLTDFTFAPPKQGLATATDLHALGSQVVSVPGLLDLTVDPSAVNYDKFELAAGHHWLVGLEVSAQGGGGTVNKSVSLFDAQGQRVATSNQGLLNNPAETYLFEGLDPGTYYVGISSSKNLPSASGLYSSNSADVTSSDLGGSYRLDLVADAADQPAELLGLRVDHADPLTTSPTGLTLQFSGGLDVQALQVATHPAVTLVDQAGHDWSLQPISYDATQGQLALAFDQALPAGTYTLEMAGANSLLDLSGREPITPGLPAGVLGSFVVAPAKPVAGDLGLVLPGPGVATPSLTAKVVVRPDAPTTEEFVILESGVYVVEGVTPASGVHFSVEDQSGRIRTTGPDLATPDGATDVLLPAGVYKLKLTTDAQPRTISITIAQPGNQASSLLEGGVAQGPALGLRFVTPQAGFGQSSGVSPAPTGPVVVEAGGPPSTLTSPGSPSSAASPTTVASSSMSPSNPANMTGSPGVGRQETSGPTMGVVLATPIGHSSSGVFYGVGPVGLPSSPAGTVGASVASGFASIAANSPGLPAGFKAVPVPIEGGGPLDLEARPPGPEAIAGDTTGPRAGATLEAGLLARSLGNRREDERTLADADGMGQLLGQAMVWFDGLSSGGEAAAAESATVVPEPSTSTGPPGLEENRVESASLTSPLGLGIVVGAIAFGARRKLQRRRLASAKAGSNVGLQAILTGPKRRHQVRVR